MGAFVGIRVGSFMGALVGARVGSLTGALVGTDIVFTFTRLNLIRLNSLAVVFWLLYPPMVIR